MTKRNMLRWVKALRSKKYKQGKHNLYDSYTNTYCCIGVYCAINKVPEEYMDKHGVSFPSWEQSESAQDFGLKFSDGGITHKNGKRTSLVFMNDRGVPFRKIADYIEKYYKLL